MTGAGIHDGDILVVNRSVEPAEGDIVIAALGGELTVKRYEVRGGRPYLVPEAEGHDPNPVREGQELIVGGGSTRSTRSRSGVPAYLAS